jgi:hypothetical protein
MVDTSQRGPEDLSSFRNMTHDGKPVGKRYGPERPLPKIGQLEFDYVSRFIEQRPRDEHWPGTVGAISWLQVPRMRRPAASHQEH